MKLTRFINTKKVPGHQLSRLFLSINFSICVRLPQLDCQFYLLNLSSVLITLPFLFFILRERQSSYCQGILTSSKEMAQVLILCLCLMWVMMAMTGTVGLLICRALTSLVAMYVLKLSCNVCCNVRSGLTDFLTVHFLCFYPVSTCYVCRSHTYAFFNKDNFLTVVNLGGSFKHFQ